MLSTTTNHTPSKKRKLIYSKHLTSLLIKRGGDYADLNYTIEAPPFERIRRITGYLVGTTDRFNDAKRAEERDRVKHTLDTTGEAN